MEAIGEQATKFREPVAKQQQVVEPLRAMVLGAPLEDARHLAQRYDRMWQEAEAQAIGVSNCQMKVREAQAIGVSKRQMKVREAQAIGVSKRQMKVREAQDDTFIGVSKRQMKGREAPGNVDNNLNLEAVELKLQELMSNMTTLGKEAVSVMTAVEAQLQRLTLHKVIAMVESECTYHRRILQILDQLD